MALIWGAACGRRWRALFNVIGPAQVAFLIQSATQRQHLGCMASHDTDPNRAVIPKPSSSSSQARCASATEPVSTEVGTALLTLLTGPRSRISPRALLGPWRARCAPRGWDSRTRSRRQAYFLPASTAAEAAAIIEPRIPLSAFSRPSDAASQVHRAKRPRPRECLEVTHAQRYTWPQPIIILHKRRRERAWPRLLGSFVLSLQLLRSKPWKSSFMCSITLYS